MNGIKKLVKIIIPNKREYMVRCHNGIVIRQDRLGCVFVSPQLFTRLHYQNTPVLYNIAFAYKKIMKMTFLSDCVLANTEGNVFEIASYTIYLQLHYVPSLTCFHLISLLLRSNFFSFVVFFFIKKKKIIIFLNNIKMQWKRQLYLRDNALAWKTE